MQAFGGVEIILIEPAPVLIRQGGAETDDLGVTLTLAQPIGDLARLKIDDDMQAGSLKALLVLQGIEDAEPAETDDDEDDQRFESSGGRPGRGGEVEAFMRFASWS
ncbi:MAG: hypothetical protein MZV65_49440 [Chromatiales bacterium]|nr:hypothetical protein [Chromatiales bacterium]